MILYDQNLPEAVGGSAEDAFLFTVSAPPASLPPHTFTILITAHSTPPTDYPRTSTSPPQHPPTVKTTLLGSTSDGLLSHSPTATPLPPPHPPPPSLPSAPPLREELYNQNTNVTYMGSLGR